jgi:hypothetical protein
MPSLPLSPSSRRPAHHGLQGALQGRDKRSPAWQAVQQALDAAAERLRQLEQLASSGTSPLREAAALADSIPAVTEWDTESGTLLVAISCAFPTLARPPAWKGRGSGGGGAAVAAASAGGAASAAAWAAAREARRAERIAAVQAAMDAGGGAVADWAAPLRAQFGASVRRGSAATARVLAPWRTLNAVLSWLAEQPAAQWVAPAPLLRTVNARAAVITQVRLSLPIPGTRVRAARALRQRPLTAAGRAAAHPTPWPVPPHPSCSHAVWTRATWRSHRPGPRPPAGLVRRAAWPGPSDRHGGQRCG